MTGGDYVDSGKAGGSMPYKTHMPMLFATGACHQSNAYRGFVEYGSDSGHPDVSGAFTLKRGRGSSGRHFLQAEDWDRRVFPCESFSH